MNSSAVASSDTVTLLYSAFPVCVLDATNFLVEARCGAAQPLAHHSASGEGSQCYRWLHALDSTLISMDRKALQREQRAHLKVRLGRLSSPGGCVATLCR